MADYSQYLMFIPGIVIFLVESGQVREYRRRSRYGATREAEVRVTKHVTKKDKFDRQVFDYFETTVESLDPKTGKKERHVIKSPVEYPMGQKVQLYFDPSSSEPVLTNGINEWVFHPWLGMLGGALLILLALFQIQGKEVAAMTCLSLLLIGAGAGMIGNYISLKRRGLTQIDSVITDIYERQVSKPGRFSGDGRFTYYPIVSYDQEGRTMMRRCNVNSGRKDSFRIGDTLKLYYSPSEGDVREHGPNLLILISGIVILILGLLAGISILSAVK